MTTLDNKNMLHLKNAALKHKKMAVFIEDNIFIRCISLLPPNTTKRDEEGLTRVERYMRYCELVGVYERQPGLTVGELIDLIIDDCRHMGVLR